MTVTSVAAVTTKFIFGICEFRFESDVSTGDFSLVRGDLHVCGHVQLRSHLSLGIDY